MRNKHLHNLLTSPIIGGVLSYNGETSPVNKIEQKELEKSNLPISDDYIDFKIIKSKPEWLEEFKDKSFEYDVEVAEYKILRNMVYIKSSHEEKYIGKLVSLNDFDLIIEINDIVKIKYSSYPKSLIINPNSKYKHNFTKHDEYIAKLRKKENRKSKGKYYPKVHVADRNMRQERNSLCNCNSGKKYKHCCVNRIG